MWVVVLFQTVSSEQSTHICISEQIFYLRSPPHFPPIPPFWEEPPKVWKGLVCFWPRFLCLCPLFVLTFSLHFQSQPSRRVPSPSLSFQTAKQQQQFDALTNTKQDANTVFSVIETARWEEKLWRLNFLPLHSCSCSMKQKLATLISFLGLKSCSTFRKEIVGKILQFVSNMFQFFSPALTLGTHGFIFSSTFWA